MSKQAVANKGGRGARQRILDTATELFYRDGINATGVEKLAAEASVSKRTLYQHFPSKTAVVEEYLRGMGQIVDDTVLRAAGGHPPDGDSFRGCPFHNAAVESAGMMPGVQGIVRAAKVGFADWLTDLAAQAGAANPRQLGGQLAVLYEGAR